jgi:iron uptake system component EfeO
MFIRARNLHLLILGTVVTGILATGCASTAASTKASGEPAGTTAVRVTLSNDGCVVEPSLIAAGPATFTVSNNGGSAVSEAELVVGSMILGEKEGLTPGLSGTFSLNLRSGKYEMYCPHAKTERSPFTVTGSATATASATSSSATLLTAATTGYRDYIEGKAQQLIALTGPFVAAVKAGNTKLAKSLYAKARAPYETIEPVAESFGDLDPEIDGREGDVPIAQWRGFHRIEKQLWIAGNTVGMGAIADRLLADVTTLARKIKTATYQPADLANGATDLLTEVGTSKLTGEEERYSRTDLTDIDANLEGSKEAFELLTPALKTVDPELATTIQARFGAVRVLLDKYVVGDGDYKLYTQLTSPQIKELAVAVDALAEPLSHVGEQIVAIK